MTILKEILLLNGNLQTIKLGEGKKIIVPEDAIGKYIRFSVIPVANSTNYPEGTKTISEVAGPVPDVLSLWSLKSDKRCLVMLI